jgi:superfamily II DNA or RNA helicase
MRLPAGLETWFCYDPRVDAYRAPANCYNDIIGPLKGELARNKAPRYQRRELSCALEMTPLSASAEALTAWQAAKGRGVVVLPTGAGKTLVGLLALCWARRDGLILVPTLDLMQQWYALLRAAFPDQEIGLIGGGYHEPQPLTIATYDSAARHIERLGDRFGLLIFDEAHHLPSEFYRASPNFRWRPTGWV